MKKLIIIIVAIAAIVAHFGWTQADNPQANGMYSAITASGALLNGLVLFFLIYEFRISRQRELSLKKKEFLIFF